MPLKSVLVTGCSEGGIGSALALEFQSRGLHVFATGRTTSKLSHLERLSNVIVLQLDVTSQESISHAAQAVQHHPVCQGKLDYLVNNAQAGYVMPTLDIDIEEAKNIYEANFWGPLRVIKGFAPLIIEAKGTIVNMCSIAGHMNIPFAGLYSSSKAALECLSEAFRLEMTPFGVNVVEVLTEGSKTYGRKHVTDLKLPADSRFKVIEDTIVSRVETVDSSPKMPPEEFAQGVVEQILEGVKGRIWKGHNVETVKDLVTGRAPQDMMDALVLQGTGLEALAKTTE